MSEVVQNLLQFQGEVPASPPTLVLGQFERVGSTFYCDQLEKTHLIHNEPYKMLVPTDWSIARGYQGELTSIDEFFGDETTPSPDKHWLRNFDASLHYPGDQVIKETNLYLALPEFLDLFPHSDIELLTRNPLGIISSFKRNDLYHRWNYANVAETLEKQLDDGKPEGYEELGNMLNQGHTWQTKLAWMIGLNAVLLSRHVDPDRVKKIVTYEQDVIPMGSPEDATRDQAQDSIFSTNIYKTHDDFEARFTPYELNSIVSAMKDCTEYVKSTFSAHDTRWFDQLYAVHLGREYHGGADNAAAKALGRVSVATEMESQSAIVSTAEIDSATERRLVKLHEDVPVLWDHSLITNEQMGTFLQSLIDKGQDSSLNYLLALDNMPPSRGGRITFDRDANTYLATEGFNNHPAYWITWLAASLYAYKEGMRLPAYAEWHRVYEDKYDHTEHTEANHTYAHDDATPTGTSERDMPDDFFGNLKIWCADWSNQQAVSKMLAGISWKHYLHDDYKTQTERPYLTNSRVIGARLVCCSECAAPQPRTMDEVMVRFNTVVELMNTSSVSTADDLAELNKKIGQAVTPDPCAHQSN